VAEPAQQQRGEDKAAGEFVCPECGRAFARPQALGAHRRAAHGIAGSSRSSAPRRQRRQAQATAAQATGATAAQPRQASGRRRRSGGSNRPSTTRTERPSVNRDALLQALFPNGIPARKNVIRAVNAWLDEADRLAQTR
jgi:C2H2-type zinc finger